MKSIEVVDTAQQEISVLGETSEDGDKAIQAKIVAEEEETFLVVRVIDGDTIELETGEKVRYIGIDTPETKHPSVDIECYGKEASDKNKELVEGKGVRLEKDVSETDKYNRLLRYIYIDNIFVNEYLVKEGFAKSSSYPPDIKHQDQLKEAEKYARENNKGLWGEICNLEPSPTPIVTNTSIPTFVPDPTSVPVQLKETETTESVIAPSPVTVSSYGCDCGKTCSQMSSCDEAYYQLNVCGCSVRDGDNDGVPCEIICPGG